MQFDLTRLPHEIVLKVIDEIILEDRATGRDQVRANSGTYALSRTSAYWQAEVEKRYRKIFMETNLFPTFARWSLQCDWLFRRGRPAFPRLRHPPRSLSNLLQGRIINASRRSNLCPFAVLIRCPTDAFQRSPLPRSAARSANEVDFTEPRPKTQASAVVPLPLSPSLVPLPLYSRAPTSERPLLPNTEDELSSDSEIQVIAGLEHAFTAMCTSPRPDGAPDYRIQK